MNIETPNERALRKLNAAVDQFCDLNGLNRKGLSAQCGIGYSTLSAILGGAGFAEGKPGPGVFKVMRLIEYIGARFEDIFGTGNGLPEVSEASNTDGVEAFDPLSDEEAEGSHAHHTLAARLFLKGGGRREAFKSIIEYSDEYEPPRPGDTSLRLIRMGHLALSTLTLGQHVPDQFQEALITVKDKKLKARWIEEYTTAAEEGEYHRVDAMDTRAPNMEKAVNLKFFKSIYRVTDANKTVTLLNFSTPLIDRRGAPLKAAGTGPQNTP